MKSISNRLLAYVLLAGIATAASGCAQLQRDWQRGEDRQAAEGAAADYYWQQMFPSEQLGSPWGER